LPSPRFMRLSLCILVALLNLFLQHYYVCKPMVARHWQCDKTPQANRNHALPPSAMRQSVAGSPSVRARRWQCDKVSRARGAAAYRRMRPSVAPLRHYVACDKSSQARLMRQSVACDKTPHATIRRMRQNAARQSVACDKTPHATIRRMRQNATCDNPSHPLRQFVAPSIPVRFRSRSGSGPGGLND
jgi:hypothetical protein